MAKLQSGTRIYGNTSIATFLTVGTNVAISGANNSTSNSTGALVISAGGLGVVGNVYTGNVIITGSGNGITFVDGTVQTTAAGDPAAAFTQANAAFIQANSASAYANAINLTQNTSITSAFIQANAAFAAANSANGSAGAAAFAQANVAFNTANSSSNTATAAYNAANAAFLQANSASAYANAINLTQNTSITAAFIQANAAFVQANSASAYANAINLTQNTSITAAFTQANAAFNQANSVYLPSVTELDVTNSGMSSFLFDQYTGDNPTLYVTAGETISFNLNVTGHPFLIRLSNLGTLYNIGLTHVTTTGTVSTQASAQAQVSGTLYWKVPSVLAGNTYVYQCQNHSGMVGNIVIGSPNQSNLAYTQANAAFIQANAVFTQSNTYVWPTANLAYAHANAAFVAANSAGGSSSAAAFTQANAAFIQANAAFSTANSAGGSASAAAFTQANAAFAQANAAFTKANTGTTSAGSAITYTRNTFTASVGQTTFTTTYTVGYLQVFVNGILLATSDFTATNGTTFTLSIAANTGDLVEAAAFSSGSYTRNTFTASVGQTAFTSTYTVGQLQVYINGVFLATSDYTATNGTTFTLNIAANTGDLVEAINVTSTTTSSVTIGKSIAMAMIFGS